MTAADQYYQRPNGKVYFLSAQDRVAVAPRGWPEADWTPITAEQAKSITATAPPPPLCLPPSTAFIAPVADDIGDSGTTPTTIQPE